MATLNDVQVGIAVDFDSSSSAPSTTNSEWSRRLILINRALLKWAQELSFRWPQLYTTTNLVTTPSVSTVDLPDDVEYGNIELSESGELKIGDMYYKLVTPGQVSSYVSSAHICWITGNNVTGFVLNIQPTPEGASTIPLKYYSNFLAVDDDGTTKKLKLEDSGDFVLCPDSDYLTYFVLSQLYKDDDEGNKGQDFERLAINSLNNMISVVVGGQSQQSQEITDLAEARGYPSIGR